MSRSTKALLLILFPLAVACWWLMRHRSVETPSILPAAVPLEPAVLAPLGIVPDWKQLDVFQNSITQTEFESLLSDVFTTGDAWRSVISISESEVLIT
ncbi:MAG: hypothetical protein WCH40_07860, partial [Verrucomicrobiales bacterium]